MNQVVERLVTVDQFQMLHALDLAVKFMGKGIAEHAYDGCVMSGEHALAIVEAALQTVKAASK